MLRDRVMGRTSRSTELGSRESLSVPRARLPYMRALALLVLVLLACKPALPAPPRVEPPSLLTQRDLVLLGHGSSEQKADLLAMPEGKVVARIEGETWLGVVPHVRGGFAFLPKTVGDPSRWHTTVRRLEVSTGRVTEIDAGAVASRSPWADSLPVALAASADGERLLAARTLTDGAIRLEAFDVRSRARLELREWHAELSGLGDHAYAHARLSPLGADRFLFVRTAAGTERARQWWTFLDAELREIATRSSDVATKWTPHGPVPQVARDEELLWSNWCDELLELPSGGLAALCGGRTRSPNRPWVALLDGRTLELATKVDLPASSEVGDFYGWTVDAQGLLALVFGKPAVVRIDPRSGRVVSRRNLGGFRLPDLLPVALAATVLQPAIQFGPNGRFAYLITYEGLGSRGIFVLDLLRGEVVGEHLRGRELRGIHLSRDGTRLYALVWEGRNDISTRILLLDPRSGAEVARTEILPRPALFVIAVEPAR